LKGRPIPKNVVGKITLGSVYYTANFKISARTLLPFKLYPALSTYEIEFVTLAASDVSESFLSSQSHKPFESESSQSHLKFFRVRVRFIT